MRTMSAPHERILTSMLSESEGSDSDHGPAVDAPKCQREGPAARGSLARALAARAASLARIVFSN